MLSGDNLLFYVAALSILQNGRIPVFQEDMLQEIFISEAPRPAIQHLRKGLDSLGIYQVIIIQDTILAHLSHWLTS